MASSDSSSLPLHLKECLVCLQDLENNYATQASFIAHFKRFLEHLTNGLAEISVSLAHYRLQKNKILLCLSQVGKVLTLFGSNPVRRQMVWYLCERLRWCVSELCQVFTVAAADTGGSDSFLHRIDLALQVLHTHGAHVPPTWKPLIDSLVYQAVTVAKIASPLDYNEITSACHKVLEESSELVSGELSVHPSQLTLLMDSLAFSLVTLEHRVNTAVLRLLLQVFSEPNKPLKQLVHKCGRLSEQRTAADLNDSVELLDAHIERIILIGQFAVSCCENTKRAAAMNCCLASLESVDNYLVPAMTAFYLDPGCQDKRDFVSFLCIHWQDQLACLHGHLDSIIDSYAFSQIVLESVSDLAEMLSREQLIQDIDCSIISRGWMLYKHLSRAADSSVDAESLVKLKQAVHECEKAVDKQAAMPVRAKCARRVVSAVETVSDQLASLSLASSTVSEGENTTRSFTLHTKIISPGPPVTGGSIRDLPLDISFTSASRSQHRPYRPLWLQKKIAETKNNGQTQDLNLTKIISKENPSVPVVTPETPKNSCKRDVNLLTPYLSQATERNTTLYVRTPRKLAQSLNSHSDTLSDSRTLALEITDILENLSALADTLSSDAQAESVVWDSHLTVRTDTMSDVNTLNRLEDLKYLDAKIQHLKAS